MTVRLEREIDLVDQLFVFASGIRVYRDPPAALVEESAVLLLYETYHHAGAETLSVKDPKDTCIEASVILLDTVDDIDRTSFGRSGDRTGGQYLPQQAAQMFSPVLRESGGDPGADLQQLFLSCFDPVDIPELLYAYILSDDAEVIAHPIDDHHMFGHLFLIREDTLFGIGETGIDRALHRIGGDGVPLYLDKTFRGEADEPALEVELELCPGIGEDLFETKVCFDRCLEGKIEQIGVARAYLFEYIFHALLVGGKIYRIFGKSEISGAFLHRVVAPGFEFVVDLFIQLIKRLGDDLGFVLGDDAEERGSGLRTFVYLSKTFFGVQPHLNTT